MRFEPNTYWLCQKGRRFGKSRTKAKPAKNLPHCAREPAHGKKRLTQARPKGCSGALRMPAHAGVCPFHGMVTTTTASDLIRSLAVPNSLQLALSVPSGLWLMLMAIQGILNGYRSARHLDRFAQ